jgi:hypothetical protein
MVMAALDHTQWHTHTHTHTHSIGLLWTSDWPLAETSTWQHTTLTKQRHQCPQRNSNPQSQQASGHRPTPQNARPLGSALIISKLINAQKHYTAIHCTELHTNRKINMKIRVENNLLPHVAYESHYGDFHRIRNSSVKLSEKLLYRNFMCSMSVHCSIQKH